ncbi:helix-turn-helix domain-containing protein [Paenibacillus montanisoli]|nr:helix-turn-helix domain-containing protein [Paenibacillus montanisoli]
MPKNQYHAEEKLSIIEEIERGELGIMAATYKYGISKTTLVKWRQRYEVYGFEGLEVQTGNKYKIASRTQLSDWVKKYNSHSSLNAYNEGAKAMTMKRSTTWQNDWRLFSTASHITRTTGRQRSSIKFPTSKFTSG